jgi:hypothetical protein
MAENRSVFYSSPTAPQRVVPTSKTPENTMQNRLATIAALTLSLIATAASAEGVRTEKNISLDLATQIAAQTVATCSANGYAVTATVVDRAGTVRAVQRADNAGPHTLEASRLKAYTSASAKNTTLAMMEGAQKNPAAANLVNIPATCCWAAACR